MIGVSVENEGKQKKSNIFQKGTVEVHWCSIGFHNGWGRLSKKNQSQSR
jgi:hypothetical protein